MSEEKKKTERKKERKKRQKCVGFCRISCSVHILVSQNKFETMKENV
jgi:hypothetical protein